MATPMLNRILDDSRAWTAGSAGGIDTWTVALPEACMSELDSWVRSSSGGPGTVTATRVSAAELPACREALRSAQQMLESGRGFAILERVPLERYSADEATAIYWALGQLLGEPFEQDLAGTLLYDVRDTGQDVTRGARFSVTNAASSFHTDGAFNPRVPDMVGLLCLKTARSGGESQLISAFSLHNQLLHDHPEVLEALYRPYCFDRRGQFPEGERPVTETPVLSWDGSELAFRYLHYYIRVGHELIERPLTREQELALEVVEALLEREDLRVSFHLEPGQMLFANNHWILHNRTAFEDFAEPELRRHYVRLWLSRRD